MLLIIEERKLPFLFYFLHEFKATSKLLDQSWESLGGLLQISLSLPELQIAKHFQSIFFMVASMIYLKFLLTVLKLTPAQPEPIAKLLL